MFSKNKPNEPTDAKPGDKPGEPKMGAPAPSSSPKPAAPAPAPAKPKPAPSILSSDLIVKGNIETSGDVQIEGTVEGDIRAHLLTVGQSAVVRGEVIADDLVVDGRVIGKVRGLKVRLTSSARVEGDIVHKTIAIESGAHFEGSVQRSDDPISGGSSSAPVKAAAASGPSGT
ncbi:MAG: bactofilin family protein [Rubricella sp.]